jgi:hypothetical protein
LMFVSEAVARFWTLVAVVSSQMLRHDNWRVDVCHPAIVHLVALARLNETTPRVHLASSI